VNRRAQRVIALGYQLSFANVFANADDRVRRFTDMLRERQYELAGHWHPLDFH
jgi:hypothetical protein